MVKGQQTYSKREQNKTNVPQFENINIRKHKSLDIKICNLTMSIVDNYNCLGVTIDSILKWSKHIDIKN